MSLSKYNFAWLSIKELSLDTLFKSFSKRLLAAKQENEKIKIKKKLILKKT